MESEEKILSVNNACFHYENNIDILHHISFDICKGDFIGILGENGVGKSTLLRMILGQLKPCIGSIYWYGINSAEFAEWYKIGYVPQKTIASGIGFPTTVGEVVMANLYKSIGRFRFPKANHRERVIDVLKLTNMDKYINRQIGKLSGGQLQRVYISRALVNSPDIIIMDEPTLGLDSNATEKLFTILETLNKEHNITILMITHDFNKAKKYFSRTYKIVDGMLVEL